VYCVTLKVISEEVDDIKVVTANGEMDYHTFRLLSDAVDQALAEDAPKIILNLAGVTYIDSSALGSLLYNQKRVRQKPADLIIISSPALTDILNLTHLDAYFKTVDSVEEGIERFQDQGAAVVRLPVEKLRKA
jgi:anti-sigma B factor antagonist